MTTASTEATFDTAILGAERGELLPSVQALATYLHDTETVRLLAERACAECIALAGTPAAGGIAVPTIGDVDALLHGFNALLTAAPADADDAQLTAFIAGLRQAPSGAALFQIPMFELLIMGIINEKKVLPHC